MITQEVWMYCDGDVTLIENYNIAIKDNTQTWHVHHRLETHDEQGNWREQQLTRRQLVEMNLYYRRPPKELIFLSPSEHDSWHKRNIQHTKEYKKRMSEKIKETHRCNPEIGQKISLALKGRKYTEEEYIAHQKGYEKLRGRVVSEETKQKQSKAMKGRKHTEEYKHHMSEVYKKVVHTKEWIENSAKVRQGMTYNKTNFSWWTNGVDNYRGAVCPEGYWKGRSVKFVPPKGTFHWYTNGKDNVRARECPKGYHIGRTS